MSCRTIFQISHNSKHGLIFMTLCAFRCCRPNGNSMELDIHNNLQPHFLMNIGDQRLSFQDMLHRPIHPAMRQSAPLPGDPLPPNHPSPVYERGFDSLPQPVIQAEKILSLHTVHAEEMASLPESELADLDAHSKLYSKKPKNGTFGLKKRCNFKVSMKKGTFFEKSKLPIDTVCKFVLFWCCMKHPTQEFLRNELSLATRTVVDWSTTCREICIHWAKSNSDKIGGDGVIVQVDEVRIAAPKTGDAWFVPFFSVLFQMAPEFKNKDKLTRKFLKKWHQN